VEVSPDELIGEYVGHSAPKARAQFERARGGILFIDEAYELYKRGKEGGGNQYGQEVITALIKFMEDDRNTIVILAGYTDEIRYLIKNGNPGLPSRVTNEFIFNDYEPEVLYNILLSNLRGFEMTEEFKDNMRQIINYEYEHRNKNEWGNARVIENYASDIFRLFLNKHDAKGIIDVDCIDEKLLNYLK
jgi:AAA+ superfamily predicted ATPase